MKSNKYKILQDIPKKKITTTKNICDLLYSIFAFKILNRYFNHLIIFLILESFKKNIKKNYRKKYEKAKLYNEYMFYKDHLHWSFEQTTQNYSGNILFTKKVDSVEDFRYCIEIYIRSMCKSINIQPDNDTIHIIIKDVLEKMKLKKMIPLLHKNHFFPFSTNLSFKEYDIVEKNKTLDINAMEYHLIRKNDILSKFPIDTIFSGFEFYSNNVFYTDNVNIKTIYKLETPFVDILKKYYISEPKHISKCIYYLLSIYSNSYDLIDNSGNVTFFIDNIKQKRLKELYNKSFDILGTPLTNFSKKSYLGLFPEIEKHFGSKGSFFDFIPESGYFSIQILFTSRLLLKRVYEKIIDWLQNIKNISFLIWVPLFSDEISNITFFNTDMFTESTFYKEEYDYTMDYEDYNNTVTHSVLVLSNK